MAHELIGFAAPDGREEKTDYEDYGDKSGEGEFVDNHGTATPGYCWHCERLDGKEFRNTGVVENCRSS